MMQEKIHYFEEKGRENTEATLRLAVETGRGADTAMVLRPEVSSRVLETKTDRIICKPIE